MNRAPGVLCLGLLVGGVGGCGRGLTPRDTPAEPMGKQEVVIVKGPTVVLFFGSFEKGEVAEDKGLSSALEHVSYAISDTAKCLEPKGVEIRTVFASLVIFEGGGSREYFRLGKASNESIGCYIVAPGRQPMVVRASSGGGASSLGVTCPGAASTYFQMPECCPEGFRCCPDGSVTGDLGECDGS